MGFLKFLLFFIGAAGLISACLVAIRAGLVDGELDLTKVKWPLPIIGLVWFLACLTVSGTFGIVPSGAVGVVLRNSATTGEVKEPGLYTICPFFCRVAILNTQVEAYPVNNATAASHDLQQTDTNIVLNFHPDPAFAVWIWNELRSDYTDRVVAPAVQEALKAATANYTAEQLITNRYRAQEDFRKDLTSRMKEFHLIIDAISMTDFKFSDQFNQAIEAKVTQEQQALQAKAKLDQVRYEADQTRTKADAEAYANRVRQQSITPELVQYEAVRAWDGHLPNVMGSGAVPFINIKGQ